MARRGGQQGKCVCVCVPAQHPWYSLRSLRGGPPDRSKVRRVRELVLRLTWFDSRIELNEDRTAGAFVRQLRVALRAHHVAGGRGPSLSGSALGDPPARPTLGTSPGHLPDRELQSQRAASGTHGCVSFPSLMPASVRRSTTTVGKRCATHRVHGRQRLGKLCNVPHRPLEGPPMGKVSGLLQNTGSSGRPRHRPSALGTKQQASNRSPSGNLQRRAQSRRRREQEEATPHSEGGDGAFSSPRGWRFPKPQAPPKLRRDRVARH